MAQETKSSSKQGMIPEISGKGKDPQPRKKPKKVELGKFLDDKGRQFGVKNSAD